VGKTEKITEKIKGGKMDHLILVIMLFINFGISWWNAKVCGENWIESKMVGGFYRLLIWCGAIQSAIGFSMIIMVLILFAGQEYIPPEVMKLAISMWYITIIIPCLGTGYIITVYSWIVAFKERSLANVGTAAWNTFASIHNTYGAVSGIKDSFGSIMSAISDIDDFRAKAFIIALIIAVAALAGGIIFTAVLIRHYEGTVPLPERRMSRA